MEKKSDRKQYTFQKLARRNLRYILIFMAPIAALLFLLSALQIRSLRLNAMAQAEGLGAKCAYDLDEGFQQMVGISYALACDPTVTALARTPRQPYTRAYLSQLKSVQYLLTLRTVYSGGSYSAMIGYAQDSFFVSASSAWHYFYTDMSYSWPPAGPMLREVLLAGEEAGWHEDSLNLYYAYPILYNGSYQGAAMTYVGFDALTGRMASVIPSYDSRLLLVDRDGAVIADSQRDGRGKALSALLPSCPMKNGFFTVDGETYAACWSDSACNGWRYVLLSPQPGYAASRNSTLLLALSLSGVTLAALSLLAILIARITCRPYDKILALLSSPIPVSESEYTRDYQPYDELGMISTLIYQTRYQNMALHTELTEQQTLLKSAQRAALQAQMNPHFLYNTLESINWLAVQSMGEGNQVSEMVTRLARFARVVTQNGEPLISIEQEIEHAKLYLDIQKLRFPDQFSIEWDVDPSLCQYLTVRVSLQPLLENSLKYGALEVSGGRIRVSCHPDGEDIRISVADNGPGIEPGALKQLLEAMEEPQTNVRGVGLINLHTRIRLIFGPPYGLAIKSQPNLTRISMRIPRRTQ